ncbi:hypothetical protein DY000_02039804 [Brassica cretica]|uniref:Ubiquitin-like protease family profile domain-containing protein n=1 Tax=Brassica cretica TaxID=69181 RepID=A0ABQ7BRA8_BRACR|nr:hypothetical protein DY000_02039804 [Brassica cretica]
MVSFTEYYWSDDDLRVAEQQRHTGGPLGDGTSDSAKTTHFSGGNGSGATPHSGGPITNDVAPLDSVDHCPSMGEAREDGVEDTSGSDGGHGKTPAGSGNNLEIIPPENEDTGKDDSSAPPSPADRSEPTSMDVELPPHSFPSKDATLPDDQTRVEKAGSPMVEPNPTFPNVPLVLISTEEGQTTGNPNPSEVVENRTSKRLRTLSVPFSPPQPQPKKAKGKGGRKKIGKLFKCFFESALPQPIKAADMVVTFIRRRMRKEGIQSCEFLPGSFVEALRGESKYCLPISSRREALDWVVIDIAQWRIHVLDCNRACVQDEKLEALLQPFVVLMPFLIRLNGGEALNEAATESPLQITRLDLPICCEPTDNIAQVSNLTEERLSIAAQTYAVEAFACFNPEHLKEFPRK